MATALKTLWTYADYLFGKRLKPALPGLIEQLEAFKEIRLNKPLRAKLLSISASSIDRLLEPEREKHTLKHRGLTKPGTLLKHQIPIRTFSDWDDARPGFLEIDLVGHEGGLAKGDFCVTLDVTDVSSGWTELAAAQNKAQIHVFAALKAIRARLPFAVLGIDSDNGSEFINSELTRYCRAERIAFTRSRPYRKNDTCYVEQRHWSIVRRYAATHATSPRCLRALNELYDTCATTRTFSALLKLREKVRDGAKVTRRYHPAKTGPSTPLGLHRQRRKRNSRNATIAQPRRTPPETPSANRRSRSKPGAPPNRVYRVRAKSKGKKTGTHMLPCPSTWPRTASAALLRCPILRSPPPEYTQTGPRDRSTLIPRSSTFLVRQRMNLEYFYLSKQAPPMETGATSPSAIMA